MTKPKRKTDEEIRERIKELDNAVTKEKRQAKPHNGVIVSLEGSIRALHWVLGE